MTRSRPRAVRWRASTPQSASSCLGFEIVAFAGFGAPKETPAYVIEKLNREVNLGLGDPKLKQPIIDLCGEPLQLSAAELESLSPKRLTSGVESSSSRERSLTDLSSALC
jgi:hypothetical protein